MCISIYIYIYVYIYIYICLSLHASYLHSPHNTPKPTAYISKMRGPKGNHKGVGWGHTTSCTLQQHETTSDSSMSKLKSGRMRAARRVNSAVASLAQNNPNP